MARKRLQRAGLWWSLFAGTFIMLLVLAIHDPSNTLLRVTSNGIWGSGGTAPFLTAIALSGLGTLLLAASLWQTWRLYREALDRAGCRLPESNHGRS